MKQVATGETQWIKEIKMASKKAQQQQQQQQGKGDEPQSDDLASDLMDMVDEEGGPELVMPDFGQGGEETPPKEANTVHRLAARFLKDLRFLTFPEGFTFPYFS
jgi:hypothetical protein